MKTTTLMFAIGLVPLFGIPALGQQPPRFDIEATCRSAPALVPQDHDPVQVCMERITGRALAEGLCIQAGWLLIAYVTARVLWHRGVRKYQAVGG